MDHRRIRRLRERLGLTQGAFADLVGTDQSSVSRWERGETLPSGPAVKMLAHLEGTARDGAAPEAA